VQKIYNYLFLDIFRFI